MFYLFNCLLFVEIESKEGRKTAHFVIIPMSIIVSLILDILTEYHSESDTSDMFWLSIRTDVIVFICNVIMFDVTMRLKKYICVFTVTCQKNLGSVGRDYFYFFLLSTKREIVVPGSGIRFPTFSQTVRVSSNFGKSKIINFTISALS
jgi:hypothetical protein